MSQKKNRKRFVIIGASPRSLINFRGPLIIKLIKENFEVIAMAAYRDSIIDSDLKKMNVKFEEYPVKRNGLNPFSDLNTLMFLRNFFKRVKPDIIFSYTIKPVVWGGIATRVMPDVRYYALITGLGYAFQNGGFLRKLLSLMVVGLYRFSLKKAVKVIFQNPDNLHEFVSRGIVPAAKCELVNGSGVDMNHFSFVPLLDDAPVTFLSIGRLLGEKGFREYAKAAQIVKQKYPNVIFNLLGPADPSPDGLSMDEVESWQKNGFVEYLGSASDVRPSIKNSHIYVLPSYHEGMPRTVLEAMSMGRPILTTDVPGCRETVVEGVNGYLVPKEDASALAERMTWYIENRNQWGRMGKCSRDIVEEKFDVNKVNAKLMRIMEL